MSRAPDDRHVPVEVNLPESIRAAVALSYDTDSGGGYLEPMVCHGRTPPFLHEYMLRLCDSAEQYGVKLHFMQIGNGLEERRVVEYLKEILARGHVVDSHTYTHMVLTTDDVDALDDELGLTNRLFEERLGWRSTVLRGPGGYDHGLDGLEANQEVILKNGFRWVSGRYCFSLYLRGLHTSIESPEREGPYAYPTGLIEIPIQGYTDRMWFDTTSAGLEIDEEAYRQFRVAYGDKPVPDGWRCTWTPPDALDAWIGHVLAVADYAYENRLLWTPVWHPYSHYVHDPENRVLPALLEHCAGKAEAFPVYTLRDILDWLEPAEAVETGQGPARRGHVAWGRMYPVDGASKARAVRKLRAWEAHTTQRCTTMTEKVPRRAQYGAHRMMAGREGEPVTIPMQYPRTVGPNAVKYLTEFVESGLTADMIGRFEAAFAEELGVRHCIATPGCTPALAALAAAFQFEPGDEVITSPISDYGTIQGLFREGYIPIFADAARATVNLSAETIEPCITDRTRAVLVVHMTGIVCDMDPINELAARHGLIVYEDCCQSTFSEYKGRPAGTLCHAAAFSFDSEKAMGSDVGGCVVTDDDDLAEAVRFHGQSRGGVVVEHFGRKHTAPGYAYRMPHCTAAICLAQLEIIRDQIYQRDKMVRLLSSRIGDIPGLTPVPIPDFQDIYSCWAFGFTLEPGRFGCSAEEFAGEVQEGGVPMADIGKMYLMPASSCFLDDWARAGRYPFSKPPASRDYAYSADSCPNARDYLEHWVYWPTFCEKYTEETCEAAAGIVGEVAERRRK